MDRRTRRQLMADLERDAAQLSRRFGLRYKAIQAERADVTSRYGVCFSDGLIKIRLRHAVTGRPLKYSSLVNTLCHELAHLRYFHHGETFKAFYLQILDYARQAGIYRPGRRLPVTPAAASARPPVRGRRIPPAARDAGPVQLGLFGNG